MSQRPRIDLDGVALHDERNPLMPLAAFRYRTTLGVLLLIPESGEVLVRWADLEDARLDLVEGRVVLRFKAAYVEREQWLRGAREIAGEWLDRYVHRL
jgi:hypothetical protein